MEDADCELSAVVMVAVVMSTNLLCVALLRGLLRWSC